MARVLALLALACLGSCAAGTGSDCDPVSDPSCRPDGPTADGFAFPDIAAHVDGNTVDSPNIPFGEACTDKFQCASRICIFSGISGYCSEICAAGSCPPGYGCYGVLGAIEPGQVSNVCVKDNNLLCTACSQSEECSTAARDLCLPSPTGGSFCARDCTAIECPEGYVCSDVTVQGTLFKQCLPTSNACDCNAINAGDRKPCDIETPFGTCAGSRTCLGATGWGDCQPPSTNDEPDGTFTDNDCDGIDGKLDGGIFVAKSGSDGPDCGLTYQSPCATINFGSQRAAHVGRSWVYVQAGDYAETLVLQDGVHFAGGYNLGWQRDARTAVGHVTRISGQIYDGESIAVVARDLATQTKLMDVVIVPKPGTGARGDLWSARSSYGVHALNAFLRLERVTINQANGADGERGGDGSNADNLGRNDAMDGCPYTGRCADDHSSDAEEKTVSCCEHGTKPGGVPGANNCGDYAGGDTRAGYGGYGGAMDEGSCGFPTFCASDAGAGGLGGYAPWFHEADPRFGVGGPGSPGAGTSMPGGAGANGWPWNGGGGGGGSGHGRIADGKYWYGWSGGNGAIGFHGSGGGGGGGSGGADDGSDSTGAGGGGGGAGGCSARSGGGGGQGGGGSFGIFGVNSGIVVRDSTIIRANGGRGGDGGTGGQGQSGGIGSPGGAGSGDSGPGGIGGNGGHGGHGGGGGGGAGGVSHGAFWLGGTVDLNTGNTISNSGDGGGGGNGGPSAPSAPPTERDGIPGDPGGSGPNQKLFSCANPSGC